MPGDALREAVLNAIMHKDYSSGATIQISVYADKLMVWNPGQLPADWTVAKLKGKHSSKPFNPDIANAFFRAGEIEAWGQGIERMFTACREAHFPEPVIDYESTGLWVIFPFAPEIIALINGKGKGGEGKKSSGKSSGESSGKTPERILAIIRGNAQITLPEIALRLGLTERAVEKQVRKLREQRVIARVGSAKGGHWEVLT